MIKKYINQSWDRHTLEIVDYLPSKTYFYGEIELTEEELQDYLRVRKEFEQWQNRIQEKAKEFF